MAKIHLVYAEGGTLRDVWEARLLRSIRRQREYGYGQDKPSSEANWLRPCPIRDHHRLFCEWVARHRPEPEIDWAIQALPEEGRFDRMVAHGSQLERLS